jgi:Effector-associated domain 1
MPLVTLSPDQKMRLKGALLAAFPTPASLNNLLIALDQSYAALAVQGSNYDQNLFEIIATAESKDWVLGLVVRAAYDLPADPAFQQLKSELQPSTPPPNVNAFEVCRLTGSHLMVNRTRLREALREIHNPLGKRILVVKGAPKTGKSHSIQLITYLKVRLGGFQLINIDLEVFSRLLGSQVLVDAHELADQIVSGLRYPWKIPDPPNDGQWARWVIEFYKGFVPLAADDEKTRWIVIDSLNSVPLAQSAYDFLKELAYRINGDLTQFRLVLLGYGESLPASVIAHVEEESIEAIGAKELAEFLVKACVELQIPLDENKVASAVQRILNKLDPAAPEFLVKLPPVANEELRRIKP